MQNRKKRHRFIGQSFRLCGRRQGWDGSRGAHFRSDVHICVCMCVHANHSVLSESLWPMDCNLPGSSVHGISQARILEWVDIPFPTQGLNLGLLHCRKILYHLSHQGSPEEVIGLLKLLWDTWVRTNNAYFRDRWDPVVLNNQLQII